MSDFSDLSLNSPHIPPPAVFSGYLSLAAGGVPFPPLAPPKVTYKTHEKSLSADKVFTESQSDPCTPLSE